jgi:hypothetical protein
VKHRGIWLTAGVLAVIVLLAQIAGASTRDGMSVANEATVSAETTAATTISLPAQASAVAQEKAKAGLATANEARTNESASARGGNEVADEASEVAVTAPAAAPRDSTTGARPGFGCGDPNHKHSGPPGRPGATLPPGCAKP